jgi:predicted nucleotidyltransferase component of viral defense system
MLQISTVQPSTLELLINLQKIDFLKFTRLVGGTALALQLGHRHSIDLDFFGQLVADTESITDQLVREGFDVKIESNSKNIHVFRINGIKTDLVNYRYAWIDNMIEDSGIRLAGLKDIAAMKIATITNRGTKKDFIDIYFLLNRFSLKEIMDFYLEKYPDGSSFLAYKSLSYFADAENQVMPKMLIPTNWDKVKKRIIAEVKLI